MDKRQIVKRLGNEEIEHLWVIYHDYSGRSCTKSVPAERFASVVEHGIVFARAAATGEVDPLTDVDSRLFVGLPV